MFDWQIDDGMFMLFGISMIIGAIWAWKIELSK